MLRLPLIILIALVPEPLWGGEFDLPPPQQASIAGERTIWATQYYIHNAPAAKAPDGIELLAQNGSPFNVRLGRHDWCHAAMEGTVRVATDAGLRTFNITGPAAREQTTCDDVFPTVRHATRSSLNRQRFVELSAREPHGLGATTAYRLVPFRSIAVDPRKIALGSALYIPTLRGVEIRLSDGERANHDGYVLAVDIGSEILGDHIDFFTGNTRGNPAPGVVTSTSSRTTKAYIINDAGTLKYLKALHSR